jgi:DNA-binding transcriptional LysR family regulator
MLSKLRQIAIFAKTVEHGSFRKAADVLHLSPSVVSHHIAKLEDEIGVALLYRSTRKLSLTSDGEALLISARTMIDAADTFLSVATNQSTQLMGELSIAMPAVLQQSELLNHIGNFGKLHSGVNLELSFSDIQKDIIKDGVDVAIRMGWLEDSGLKARKLYDVNRHVVASTAYLKTKTKKVTVQEVETWDWIELTPVGFRNLYSFPNEPKRLFKPKSKVRLNSAIAINHLVLNDGGVASLPEFITEKNVANGTLKRLLPEIDLVPIGVYAVWPANAPKGGLTSRFVEHLKECLA